MANLRQILKELKASDSEKQLLRRELKRWRDNDIEVKQFDINSRFFGEKVGIHLSDSFISRGLRAYGVRGYVNQLQEARRRVNKGETSEISGFIDSLIDDLGIIGIRVTREQLEQMDDDRLNAIADLVAEYMRYENQKDDFSSEYKYYNVQDAIKREILELL